MTASERRVLINHLVTNANDEALHNDTMRLGCFTRTGGLMTYTKSESDNLIKPQRVISKITMPEVYNPKDYELPNSTEYVSPTDVLNPENDSGSSDIHEDNLINDVTDLVMKRIHRPKFSWKQLKF